MTAGGGPSAEPLVARFGVIHRTAQFNLCNPLRPDTPTQVRGLPFVRRRERGVALFKAEPKNGKDDDLLERLCRLRQPLARGKGQPGKTEPRGPKCGVPGWHHGILPPRRVPGQAKSHPARPSQEFDSGGRLRVVMLVIMPPLFLAPPPVRVPIGRNWRDKTSVRALPRLDGASVALDRQMARALQEEVRARQAADEAALRQRVAEEQRRADEAEASKRGAQGAKGAEKEALPQRPDGDNGQGP
jgi:hypothetical protein